MKIQSIHVLIGSMVVAVGCVVVDADLSGWMTAFGVYLVALALFRK